MDSKKLELEKRLSALDGFTKSEEFVYRTILLTIFNDARRNVFIIKEFLRYYYKNTKVIKHTKSFVNESKCSYEERECINYEISPKFKDVINITIDKITKKVYKRFVEKLDYFLANGKLKLIEYEDYLHDPDDYKSDPELWDDHPAWKDYQNKSFEYGYGNRCYFTEYHSFIRSDYKFYICNLEYKDLNTKINNVFYEKCKLYSNSLAKFKNNFVKELKNNLLQFKYNYGFQLIFKDITKREINDAYIQHYVGRPVVYELKKFINKKYNNTSLNFAVPYLTEINRDVIEKRKAIQAEIDALSTEQ